MRIGISIPISNQTHKIKIRIIASELELLMNRENRYTDLLDRNKVLISKMIYQGLTSDEVMRLDVEH